MKTSLTDKSDSGDCNMWIDDIKRVIDEIKKLEDEAVIMGDLTPPSFNIGKATAFARCRKLLEGLLE